MPLRTVHGRSVPAPERNENQDAFVVAPTRSGVRITFGLFTTVTAVLMASRYGSGDLQHGTGFEYQAISAVLVGGTAIQGGHGSVLRTFIGTILIAIFKAVLILRGFSTELQQLLIGVVVLLVIMLQWRAGDLK